MSIYQEKGTVFLRLGLITRVSQVTRIVGTQAALMLFTLYFQIYNYDWETNI